MYVWVSGDCPPKKNTTKPGGGGWGECWINKMLDFNTGNLCPFNVFLPTVNVFFF